MLRKQEFVGENSSPTIKKRPEDNLGPIDLSKGKRWEVLLEAHGLKISDHLGEIFYMC